MLRTSLTIINDGNVRGIIAPARTLSKKMLEDIIDFIELSRPESIREDEKRIRQADRTRSWMSQDIVDEHLKKRIGHAR